MRSINKLTVTQAQMLSRNELNDSFNIHLPSRRNHDRIYWYVIIMFAYLKKGDEQGYKFSVEPTFIFNFLLCWFFFVGLIMVLDTSLFFLRDLISIHFLCALYLKNNWKIITIIFQFPTYSPNFFTSLPRWIINANMVSRSLHTKLVWHTCMQDVVV